MDNSTSTHSAGLIRNIIISITLISAICACITIIINNTIPDNIPASHEFEYSVENIKSNATYIFAYDKYIELEQEKNKSNEVNSVYTNKIGSAEDIDKNANKGSIDDKTNKIDGANEEVAENDTNQNDSVQDVNTQDPNQNDQPPQAPPVANWWNYPDPIYETTRNGDDMLVLVNKQYRLSASYYPSDLVDLSQTGIPDSGGKQGRAIMITNLTQMYNDAYAEGINLSLLSGFRSYDTQVSTYNYWVNYNGGDIDYTDTISARPGHSQHQLGTAIDFGVYEDGYLQMWQDFNDTRAADWLAQNAWKYGFALSFPAGAESTTGFAYEGWHFRFIGVDNASDWHASGLLLELWLRGLN